MPQTLGLVATPEASRYLQRLCYHFSRKITVQYDTHQGQAQFPWGTCAMRADDSHLHFDCAADSEEGLARVCHAISEHVKLFSRKNPMQVQWSACAETQA
ncbi:DUF2218 domain-containing protein [Comamonas sp. J-3]|jgi:hypothetical protein|uniref:DUF2218 domain-containing protein n=1 Tax=Comamonas trifloxystrobinivorans TaxID=3350256 RepID=UPI0037288EA0